MRHNVACGGKPAPGRTAGRERERGCCDCSGRGENCFMGLPGSLEETRRERPLKGQDFQVPGIRRVHKKVNWLRYYILLNILKEGFYENQYPGNPCDSCIAADFPVRSGHVRRNKKHD